MTDQNITSEWQWWAGSNEEFFDVGPCSTREAAIKEATDENLGEFKDENGQWKLGIHLIEARRDPLMLSEWVDIEHMLERADESVGDSDRVTEFDDAPYFDCSKEQEQDLERRLKETMDAWQKDNGLVFMTKAFSRSRNADYLVVPVPGDST